MKRSCRWRKSAGWRRRSRNRSRGRYMSEWNGTILRALLDASLLSVLIVAGVAIVLLVFRIRSAAVRHAVWTLALVAMLLMPILPNAIPPIAVEFPVPVPSSPVEALVWSVPDAPPA